MRPSLVVVTLALGSVLCAACGSDPGGPGGTSGQLQSGSVTPGEGEGEGGEGGGTGGGASSDDAAAALCVKTINEYRATKGLPAYARWTAIEACSDGEARSDGETKKPHGAFPGCGELGQNECPGWDGPATTMIPKCLKAMWAEGPGGGHYEAMASKKYTKVACGFATVNGEVWSVQNFK